MKTLETLRALAQDQFLNTQKIRRTLHCHPELSGNEYWTSNYIASQLENLGLIVKRIVGGYGIIADLVVDPLKPTAALRVDIDALPIHEVNQVPYRSQIDGVMHACGHDVHSAIGIGSAAVLCNLTHELPGNIRFIFQPEEEEITGAQRMIDAGALENPTPSAIFGLHVAPLPAGKIAWTESLFLAGFDHFLVSILPKSRSSPFLDDLDKIAERCCKAILDLNQWKLPITWETMQTFWQEMQRTASPLRQFMVFDASQEEEDPEDWFGQFGLGIKAANPGLRKKALRRVRDVLNSLCKNSRTRYRIEKVGTMMDMRNNTELVHSVLPALKTTLGEDNLIQLHAAFPFNCEDFAFYTQQIPGAMIWLGAADPENQKYAILHTPDFDVDESCLISGMVALSAMLIEHLGSILS
jgi:amidohydrolase